jgi:chromosome partitioning protein
MSIPVLTFFNNKGGVGKTSLVFHLSWIFSKMGLNVVAIDLDPQANLTSAFLSEDQLETLWSEEAWISGPNTVFKCLQPLMETGDILNPIPTKVRHNLHLIPGDLALAGYEDMLSSAWLEAMGSRNQLRPMRILSSFWQVAQMTATTHGADIIIADVGPNLGAINRSALIATDHVVIPLAADLFSLQGLMNLGPTLREWRSDWKKRTHNWQTPSFDLPEGNMQPAGYVLMQHSELLNRPTKAYRKWADRIPETYQGKILGGQANLLADDFNCLAKLKHYRSLVPMALEARKPIFELTSSDGAIGNHLYAVRDAGADFRNLAEKIISRIGLNTPAPHARLPLPPIPPSPFPLV